MCKKTIFVIGCVLLIAAPVASQGTIDKYGNFHPTEEAIARNKRIGELLQHPTFILLRLVSQRRNNVKEEPTTTPAPYSSDERVHFELFLTQNSSEDITFTESSWPYTSYRPELIRDGDPVPYSEKAQKNVELPERVAFSGSMGISTITPGKECFWTDVRIEDWYDSPLKPGRYQLIVKKRFTRNGDWTESNPVTFDVVASKSAPGAGSLLVAAHGQSNHDLEKLDQKIIKDFESKLPQWSHKRGEPIQGSTDVLIEKFVWSHRIVHISVVPHKSAAEAREAIERFVRYDSEKEQLQGFGDEAYAWGYALGKVALRKGRYAIFIDVHADVDSDADA